MTRFPTTALRHWGVLAFLVSVLFVTPAFAAVDPGKTVIFDDLDPAFSLTPPTGTWTNIFNGDPTIIGVLYGESAWYVAGAGTETATASWVLGAVATATGLYKFEAFVPDDTGATNTDTRYRLERNASSDCSGAWSLDGLPFTSVSQSSFEGRWMLVGSRNLTSGTCYRLVLSNNSTDVSRIYADAVQVTRLFESRATIPDMPFALSTSTPGTTPIASTTNASPSIVVTRSITCPANGNVLATGSGESTAQSNASGTSFIGLAYSISLDSLATDNTNVVQSSALAVFNGDANRDFLSVQRFDTCTAGTTYTYRLTAYRTTPTTGTASFIWNGRLTVQYFP